jgi:hypothetical protein
MVSPGVCPYDDPSDYLRQGVMRVRYEGWGNVADNFGRDYAPLIDEASPEELKLALLRAIDHNRKVACEIDKYKAAADRANAELVALRSELRHRGLIRRIHWAIRERLKKKLKNVIARLRALSQSS